MYDSSYHSKTYLRYHIIFSTKYRRKCLTEIRDYVKEDVKSFKEDICVVEEVHETTQTNENDSRYVYYGIDLDEFYSASLHVCEPC